MIKILHVVPNMQAGGLETFIMNIMRNISDEVEFDFLVHYKEKKGFIFHEENTASEVVMNESFYQGDLLGPGHVFQICSHSMLVLIPMPIKFCY